LMALCDVRFSAFQFALLSALASVARSFLGPPAATLVESMGWAQFFIVTFFTALPGLALLWWLRGRIRGLDAVK
jgi:PAT family beta-lactamase induction signal transducer AmpG